MKVTDKDVKAIEVALDHFESDIEGGCEDESFYAHRDMIKALHDKIKRNKAVITAEVVE